MTLIPDCDSLEKTSPASHTHEMHSQKYALFLVRSSIHTTHVHRDAAPICIMILLLQKEVLWSSVVATLPESVGSLDGRKRILETDTHVSKR